MLCADTGLVEIGIEFMGARGASSLDAGLASVPPAAALREDLAAAVRLQACDHAALSKAGRRCY